MSGEAWLVVALVILMIPVSFLGMYFEHRAKWESDRPAFPPKAKQPNHFHGIGFGVSAPCDDKRCPEWTEGS